MDRYVGKLCGEITRRVGLRCKNGVVAGLKTGVILYKFVICIGGGNYIYF